MSRRFRGVVVLVAAMILGATVLGSLGTWYVAKRPPSYSSKAVLMVSPKAPAGAGAFLDRVPTMAKLAQTDEVLLPAAKRLGFPDAAALQPFVVVESPAKTILINVSATAGDPRRAQEIANAVAQSLRSELTGLYDKGGPASQTVVASVVDPATGGVSETPVASGLVGLVTALLGAAIGFGVVSLWRAARGGRVG